MTDDLASQIQELTRTHRGLANVQRRGADTVISGELSFTASAEGLETITDCFIIEIIVPPNYSADLPRARETGGRIGPEYPHRNPDGTMCLAVPIEQRRLFLKEPSLKGYVENLVVPYLYGYTYWSRHRAHPFDEAAHGAEGIVRHYVEWLKLPDETCVLAAVCQLLEFGYRGHHECPCGSGQRIRDCHGPALKELADLHTQKSLDADFFEVIRYFHHRLERKEVDLPTQLLKQVVRLLKSHRRH